MRNYDPTAPLIFLHIPKTAGTFFREIIAKEYPNIQSPKTMKAFIQAIFTKEYSSKQCLYLYYPMPYDINLIDELKKEANHKRAIYGHVSYGIHQLLDIPPQYITILRHPLERVVSFYLHNAKYTEATYYSDIQAGMSLLEMLENDITPEVNNHLTRIIAHEPFVGKLEDFTVLDRAFTHLEQDFCFVGLTEKLEASINTLATKLAWRYSHSIPSSASQTQQYIHQLDKKTLTALKDYNHLDLLLYDYATRLFHHEVK